MGACEVAVRGCGGGGSGGVGGEQSEESDVGIDTSEMGRILGVWPEKHAGKLFPAAVGGGRRRDGKRKEEGEYINVKEDTACQRQYFTRKYAYSIPNTAYPTAYIRRDVGLGGEMPVSELRQKGVYEESFSRHAAWIGEKLIQLMHIKMVQEQKSETVNTEVQLQALVDGKKVIVTESSVRRDLQLEDVEGVDCLPNAAIFKQLALMGYVFDEDMFGVNDLDGDEVIVKSVDVGNIAEETRTLAELKSAELKADKVVIQEPEQGTTTPTLTTTTDATTITAVSTRPRAKGLLQAEEEEEERLAKEKSQQVKESNIAWDDVQAKIDADYQLAQRLQAQEQDEFTNAEKLEEDKESEELKQCLEIFPDDGDDVTIDATPLSTKSPTIVDYKIYKEGKKSYF
ncbi:hypothetical protein Tco_1429532 [Tanacetum coccineum]